MAASRISWWGTAAIWAVAPFLGFFLLPVLFFLPGLFGGDPLIAMLILRDRLGWLVLMPVWSVAVWIVMFQHRGAMRRLIHFAGANLFGALGILCALTAVN